MRLAVFLLTAVGLATAPPSLHDAFNAHQTYLYTAQVTGFGERNPGSPGHQKTEDLIHQVLLRDGARIEADNFTAQTPHGPIAVHNIVGKFNDNGDPKQVIFILGGHYDTLFRKGFVGANDGGSSTAILLGFADALAHQKTKMQLWLFWTDLEEAVTTFDDPNDGLYGSRHYAKKLVTTGVAPRVKGFFLLDMIGDKNLSVDKETTSSAWLQGYIARAATQLGYSKYFFGYDMEIIDDQKSFLDVGIPAVDVVDAEYGAMGPAYDAMGQYHHSNLDTMDKVSEQSLQIVGRTILLTVELLDQQPGLRR